jgi:hypothetical protein
MLGYCYAAQKPGSFVMLSTHIQFVTCELIKLVLLGSNIPLQGSAAVQYLSQSCLIVCQYLYLLKTHRLLPYPYKKHKLCHGLILCAELAGPS